VKFLIFTVGVVELFGDARRPQVCSGLGAEGFLPLLQASGDLEVFVDEVLLLTEVKGSVLRRP
jgi:hypothetical protein